MNTRVLHSVFVCLLVLTVQPYLSSAGAQESDEYTRVPDKRIVDCLLQGNIRKLGNTIYQSPPRPVKIPAIDCEIRGGDFLVFDRASYSSTMSHWLSLAKQGDVNAQIYLGEIFERGMGREPDYAQAAAWYSKAAETGHPAAQISLAQLYEKGLGVDQNPVEAERLYALAFGTGSGEVVALDPGSLGDPANRIQGLELSLSNTRNEVQALSDQLMAARQSLSQAQSEFDQQQIEKQRLQNQLQSAQGAFEAASADSDSVRIAQERLDDSNASLIEHESTIELLREEVIRNQSEIDAYQAQIGRISELEAQLQQQSHQYEVANAELRETRAALARSNNDLSVKQGTFESEKHELELVREELNRNNQSSAEEQQSLAQQLNERESRLAHQASDLENMRVEVETYQASSLELQSRLSQLTRQNQELQNTQEETKRFREESQRLRSVLAKTELQLDAMQAKPKKGDQLAKTEIELKRVRKEANRYKDRIVALESAQQSVADLAGPTIQVIEPVAFNTRGNSDIVVKAVEHQQIVGKISAPAGLLTVSVNQQITEVNDRNVFQALVELTGEKTLVQIAAIDNQGKRTEQLFSLLNKDIKTIPARLKVPDISFGKFHALLIGNEEYAKLPDLVTPKEDIHTIDSILRDQYGFKTTVVEDGTREKIMDVMYELLGELTSEDNLLIYYAGHGEYVTDTNRGVWLPTDASPNSPANWITNVEISDYLKQIRAKQIVVIADSCYSGALTRSAMINLRPGLTDEEYVAHLEKMTQVRARVVLTSGGLAPVLDSANPGSQHSIFATALIEILQQNDAVLSAQDLGRTIAAKVSLAASRVGYDQEPQYAPMNHASHQGGDFFFVPVAL